MADLTTYQFYTGTYHGDSVSQTDFPKYLVRATDEIDFLTYGNITDETYAEYSEKIQKAVCALIDCLYKLDQAEANANSTDDGNIKSRSSGGESISYGSADTAYTKAMVDSTSKRKLEYETIKPYLTGTGLFYAGI